MPSDISRELEQLKKDTSHQTPVIKNQDWKKSQWHGWADRVNPNTTIEYKSPLEPAGSKKDRGQNAKKRLRVYSNHWDQDPRDPDYVEEEEPTDEVETVEKRDESGSEYEDSPEEKVGGKKVRGKKVATKKRTTRSGGKRA